MILVDLELWRRGVEASSRMFGPMQNYPWLCGRKAEAPGITTFSNAYSDQEVDS